ncbi:MAG: phosphohistidine phosphatase [Saprospiraceae bacterium]|jgi:phosphohistidine phosphatase
MKTIFFVRHAKSSWEDMTLGDKARPLNPRGKRDAPFMAKLLKGKGTKADAIIASPANRAFTTAKYFAEELGIGKEDIIVKEEIYEAYTEDVLEIISNLDNQLNTVLIFGHNPTFTSLANRYSKEYIPNVPTCGIIKIESSVEQWSSFDPDNARVTDILFPKEYLS